MRIFQVKSDCNRTVTHRVKFDQSNSPLVLFCGAFIVIIIVVIVIVIVIVIVRMIRGLS